MNANCINPSRIFVALAGSRQFASWGRARFGRSANTLFAPLVEGRKAFQASKGPFGLNRSLMSSGAGGVGKLLNRDSNPTPDSRPSVIAFRS